MFPAFHKAIVEKLGAVFSKTLTQISERLQKLFLWTAGGLLSKHDPRKHPFGAGAPCLQGDCPIHPDSST